MMSAKFLDFCPLPPCPHLDLIYTINFNQPPLLRPLFHDPPPPSDADIIYGCSLTSSDLGIIPPPPAPAEDRADGPSV